MYLAFTDFEKHKAFENQIKLQAAKPEQHAVGNSPWEWSLVTPVGFNVVSEES